VSKGVQAYEEERDRSVRKGRPADTNEDTGSAEADSESAENSTARNQQDLKLRREQRKYPRSKVQQMVDTAEDDPEGATLLDLSHLGLTRISSRVWGIDTLEELILRVAILCTI
jgi:hypothetical protein